jgi:hypothetical protein
LSLFWELPAYAASSVRMDVRIILISAARGKHLTRLHRVCRWHIYHLLHKSKHFYLLQQCRQYSKPA